MLRAALLIGLSLASAHAPSASAQGIPSAADAPREGEEIKGETGVVEIREVERGFYLSVDAGPNYFLNLPFPLFVPINPTWLAPGQRMGLRVGYDIFNNLNVEGYLTSQFNRGVVDPARLQAGGVSGDVTQVSPGLAMRFAFITTERFFLFARAGLGVDFWFPPKLAAGSLTGFVVEDFAMGIHSDVSLGFEYYTQLRHLSVGFEVAAQGSYLPFAFGVMAYPTVKYTF